MVVNFVQACSSRAAVDRIFAGAEGVRHPETDRRAHGKRYGKGEENEMAAPYDLVVRGGHIFDGTGRPEFTGDIAIRNGLITAIGRVDGAGREEIDATDRAVTPGFVDIHTHYDGHVTWTDRLNPSSQHGVTTVVMGNCGVGFAPCRPEDHERLVRLMEGVEDIPEVVLTAGLPWSWESFPEYLDRLAERRFDMDIAAQLPHAPLRVYVMGDRALAREPADANDIAYMRALAKQAIEAGALGFSTSRSLNHKASDGTLTPSYAAAADELAGIASGLADAGGGVLQFISDFDDVDSEFAILRRMVQESGRPLSLTVLQLPNAPTRWRQILDRIEAANAEGLPVKGQVCGRPVGVMLGFGLGRNPFMFTPSYLEIDHLSLEERFSALNDPDRRARILSEFPGTSNAMFFPVLVNFAAMYEFASGSDYEPPPTQNIAARATARGIAPAEFAYDLLASEIDAVLYIPAANFAENSIQAIETMLTSDYTILGLGDGGAHCGFICDASLPTYMIQRWSTAGGGPLPIERVVKALTSQTAGTVGLDDRGAITIGRRADLNIINFGHLRLHKPRMICDLPLGGGRLGQDASGYDATIVAGEVTYREGTATGARPGRLVRGARGMSAR